MVCGGEINRRVQLRYCWLLYSQILASTLNAELSIQETKLTSQKRYTTIIIDKRAFSATTVC